MSWETSFVRCVQGQYSKRRREWQNCSVFIQPRGAREIRHQCQVVGAPRQRKPIQCTAVRIPGRTGQLPWQQKGVFRGENKSKYAMASRNLIFIYFTITFLHLKGVYTECIDFVFYEFSNFYCLECSDVKDVSLFVSTLLKLQIKIKKERK